MKAKAMLLLAICLLWGCSKSTNTDVLLTGKLTDCAANNTCTYNYYENSDLNQYNQLVNGNYRVFEYKSISPDVCDATTTINFKTAINTSDFVITANQISAGQLVTYAFSCACCDNLANVKPIGGNIKGKKIGANTWLVNAAVILGTSATRPIDTLVVNQYFTLATR